MKFTFLFVLFFSFYNQAQLYIDDQLYFINSLTLNWQQNLYSQNTIPKNLKGEIKEIKKTSITKKNTSVFTEKFDNQGRIVSSNLSGKNTIKTEVSYGVNNNPISYKKEKNGKPTYESGLTMDEKNRTIEKFVKRKNKLESKMLMTYGEGTCPLTVDQFYKNNEKPSSRWVNTYYADCDKKSTLLYNKKGKVQKTWTYDCKQEGEVLLAKKDVTQVCKWDEETDKYFIKVTQDFDEKGKIRKKVEKLNKADSCLAEYSFYNDEDLITYRYTSNLDLSNNIRTTVTENFRKGELFSISTSKYYVKPKVPEEKFKTTILLSQEKLKKGKLRYKEINVLENEKIVKHETFNKKGLRTQWLHTYSNGNLVATKNSFKGKLTNSSKTEYNEKGLITKKEVFDKKGNLKSTSNFEYVY